MRIRQVQSLILRLPCRISWIEQKGKEERREGRELENRETEKEDSEILDRNGGINNEIFSIMGNNQHERFHPIWINPPKERQLEYQQPIMIVKDNEIRGKGRRCDRVRDND
ncbi:MAG: hypothetical protein EZS28_041213 [Streblomastix strix]|uniref:Uncharacterized protein n=1 Tax=Streblomastix strix TaxID=222440 RepID=A0A5J4TZZ0_9EUKA|nr:MAG: hypothetical protein EZS28_041213 [Streblomastix strix]